MCSDLDPAQHRQLLLIDPPRVALDGAVSYRRGWALGVSESPGVYLIHDLRGMLYIGRADNLRRRFEDHLLRSHNPALRRALRTPVGPLTFSWVLVASSQQIEFERTLIRSFRPLCNVQHNAGSAARCA